MDWDCAIAFWAWKVYNTKDSEQKNEKTLNERNQKKGEHKKMKEKSSLAKRLSGLIALSLVLAMTMGITARAATTYYTWSPATLCTDVQMKTPLQKTVRLQAGDIIEYSKSDTDNHSGIVIIKPDIGEEKRLYKDAGSDTYVVQHECTWEISSDTINLTTYNPESVPTTPTNTSSPTRPSCNHRVVELRTVRETTATQDGIRAWFCVDCDEKLSEEMLSSYAFFLQSIIYQVEHAESGSTVEISSEIWNSLSQDVMLALAARRDINIVFTLRYNHEDYRIEIPAGTTIDTGDPYYGPLYLGQLYGMTKIEK